MQVIKRGPRSQRVSAGKRKGSIQVLDLVAVTVKGYQVVPGKWTSVDSAASNPFSRELPAGINSSRGVKIRPRPGGWINPFHHF
jgi:hypothetical protein